MTPSKTEKLPTARRIAYAVLFDVLEKEAYANLSLQAALRKYRLSAEDIRFLTELVYGTIRRYNHLLWVIGRFSARPVKKLDPPVRILLALGLYQLMFLDSVPDSAAVNETVKIAKAVSHEGNARFVNALLRNYLRKKDTLAMPDAETEPDVHDALFYNEPEWLVRRWTKEWGRERARAVFSAFNTIAPTDIRCNTLRISEEALLEKLTALGAAPKALSAFPGGIELGESGPFFRSSLLKEGLAYVQNRASMLPALVLAPEAGETILDMCAAPGSKTTQIAALMGDTGRIAAWDIYPHKAELIRANAKRLGMRSITAAVHDSSVPQKKLFAHYDRVLLDAPCSGLGVIRRKPEIRWRRKEKDLAVFPAMQKKLLDAAAQYVKPGGILVYSTCTLLREENEGIVEDFLAAHPEFELLPIALPCFTAESGMLTLYPDIHESDGFFAARLRRNDEH